MTDQLVGKVIHDRYRVIRKLGEGGMGAVYEVEHVLVGRRLALKTLHADLSRDADVVARFHREARSAAAVGSQHIVDITDMGRLDDGTPYIVMEYIDAPSLRHLLADGAMPLPRAISIVAQCCRALAAAHAKGIVHRDLKPDNIMIAERDGDFVKLVDFGIAKLLEDAMRVDGVATTKTGYLMGTPQYCAPEQLAGRSDIDARTDVWAMGVVLFETVTGSLPWDAQALPLLAARIFTEDTPSMAERRPGIPPRLQAVVERALAKERTGRFATIGELADALDKLKMGPAATTQKPGAFVADEETAIDTLPAGARAAGSRASTTPRAWDVGHETRPPRRRIPLGLAIAAGAVGLLGIVGVAAIAFTLARTDEQPHVATLASSSVPIAAPSSAPSPPTTAIEPSVEHGAPSPPPDVPATPTPAPDVPTGEPDVPTGEPAPLGDRPRSTARRQPERTPTHVTSPPIEPTVARPSPTPATSAPPVRSSSSRRVSIQNSTQLAVSVSLTCGDSPPVNVRVPARGTRTVTLSDDACRVRCDDGVSVGSLCGTRLSATSTSLVIR